MSSENANKNYLENLRERYKVGNVKICPRQTGSEEGKWIGLAVGRNQTKYRNRVRNVTLKKKKMRNSFKFSFMTAQRTGHVEA
jgi:hypothetical protein